MTGPEVQAIVDGPEPALPPGSRPSAGLGAGRGPRGRLDAGRCGSGCGHRAVESAWKLERVPFARGCAQPGQIDCVIRCKGGLDHVRLDRSSRLERSRSCEKGGGQNKLRVYKSSPDSLRPPARSAELASPFVIGRSPALVILCQQVLGELSESCKEMVSLRFLRQRKVFANCELRYSRPGNSLHPGRAETRRSAHPARSVLQTRHQPETPLAAGDSLGAVDAPRIVLVFPRPYAVKDLLFQR